MSKLLKASNFDPKVENESVDLLVYCVGYEQRSRCVAESERVTASATLAIAYSVGRELSFVSNYSFATSMGSEIVGDQSPAIIDALRRKIYLARSGSQAIRIAVDVSAMDRGVMACVLAECYDQLRAGDVLRLLYAPAKYREPRLEMHPIREYGTVHASLSGAIRAPSFSRVLLLGIGYEYGLALSVLDKHEPDMSFVFRPIGFDERYRQSLETANFGFDFGERDYEVIDYYLLDLSGLFSVVSSIITSSKHNSHVVVCPLGPKIFSAVSIVAGLQHRPTVAVLRYSMVKGSQQEDVEADGRIVGLSLEMVLEY